MATDTIVPVTARPGGPRIGTARLSEKGDILNVEIDNEMISAALRESLLWGLADSISIQPNYVPAVPKNKENENGTTTA